MSGRANNGWVGWLRNGWPRWNCSWRLAARTWRISLQLEGRETGHGGFSLTDPQAHGHRRTPAASEVLPLCAAPAGRESKRKTSAGAKRGWSPVVWGVQARSRRVSPLRRPRRRPLMPIAPNLARTRWYVAPSSSACCACAEPTMCLGRASRGLSCAQNRARVHGRACVCVSARATAPRAPPRCKLT